MIDTNELMAEKLKNSKCCIRQHLVSGYAWFWPFRVKYCTNCGECISDTNIILDFIWELFIWPFWDGRVKINKDELPSN